MVRSVKEELQASEEEVHQKRERALFDLKTFELEISFVTRHSLTEKAVACTTATAACNCLLQ